MERMVTLAATSPSNAAQPRHATAIPFQNVVISVQRSRVQRRRASEVRYNGRVGQRQMAKDSANIGGLSRSILRQFTNAAHSTIA